jgi:hypothetical protein
MRLNDCNKAAHQARLGRSMHFNGLVSNRPIRDGRKTEI